MIGGLQYKGVAIQRSIRLRTLSGPLKVAVQGVELRMDDFVSLQYPPREIDQNQNNPSRDFSIPTFNPRLLHNGEHSTHARKGEAPL